MKTATTKPGTRPAGAAAATATAAASSAPLPAPRRPATAAAIGDNTAPVAAPQKRRGGTTPSRSSSGSSSGRFTGLWYMAVGAVGLLTVQTVVVGRGNISRWHNAGGMMVVGDNGNDITSNNNNNGVDFGTPISVATVVAVSNSNNHNDENNNDTDRNRVRGGPAVPPAGTALATTEQRPPRRKRKKKRSKNGKRGQRRQQVLDWTDPIFKRGSGWDVSPVVVERYRLLFFTVPKVACTTFKALFRRMGGYADWATKSPHDPKTNGLQYLSHYNRTAQAEYMTSPDWTRAIFVRDPLARTLSAYLEKGLGNDTGTVAGDYLKRMCCHIQSPLLEQKKQKQKQNQNQTQQDGGWTTALKQRQQIQAAVRIPPCRGLAPYERPTDKSTNLPFGTFVTSFLKQCRDPHWTPQARRLRPRNWDYVTFVGRFEHVQDDAERLLKHIGAWDEFGASGWGGGSGGEQHNNNESLFETNTARHQTSSDGSMEEYYHHHHNKDDPASTIVVDVERLVLEYCRVDYDHPVLNFTKPKNYHLYFGGTGAAAEDG